MDGTERYWRVLGVSIVLAAGALIFTRPLLVLGAVSLWVWLISAQIGFAYRVEAIVENIQLSHEVSDSTTTAGSHVAVTLKATLTTSSKETITVQGHPPVSATGTTAADQVVTLDPGETTREHTYTMRLPATGRISLRGTSYVISDRYGLFTQAVHRQPTDETHIEVSPYGPAQMQIGSDTQSIGRGYGDHEATHGGGGIDPQEPREYVPGDSVSDIDWNATARLPETYVREYDAAMTHQTLIALDTRPEMKQGPPGRTMLAHARRVCHGILQTTQRQSDPLGWLTVDDGDSAGLIEPQSTPTQYRRAKRFFDTVGVSSTDTVATNQVNPELNSEDATSTGSHREAATAITNNYHRSGKALADRKEIATRLATADSVFASQLHPFFMNTGGYMEAIDTDSLFHSLRVGLRNIPGAVWTVIITSDSRRSELFETVQMANQDEGHVAVFITPSVLFTDSVEIDPEEAYEQYQSFEHFRERLDRLAGVTAFEVGPQDRLAEILDSPVANSQGAQL